MWEREDFFGRDKYPTRRRNTPTTFEAGREARRRIRKENRKINKNK